MLNDVKGWLVFRMIFATCVAALAAAFSSSSTDWVLKIMYALVAGFVLSELPKLMRQLRHLLELDEEERKRREQ